MLRTRVSHGYRFGWDGMLRGPLSEAVLSSALASSVEPGELPHKSLQRIEDWMLDVPVPRDPFAIDRALAAQGSTLFEQGCAGCHAVGGARTGKVEPIVAVGTDRQRLDSWTKQAADKVDGLGEGWPWNLHGFEKTDGYANVLLDGIWLRAPYLHNGSVPTLADLLEPPASRPRVFWRGCDVYDQAKVGFGEKQALVEYMKTL